VRRFLPFILWLGVAYSAWLAIIALGDHWRTIPDHWPIAAAMVFGSFFAGSTPVGGGAVGYSALVLLMDEPARLGRAFAFSIQAVGMTSATIYAICAGRRLAWRPLRWAMLGSLIATPIGVGLIAPRLTDQLVSLVFAGAWASFGALVLTRIRTLASQHDLAPASARVERLGGFLAGLIAGLTVAGITGAGADMLMFLMLVLLLRADLRIAIPTGVAAMGFTSIIGIASTLALRRLDPAAYPLPEGLLANWITTVPIVLIGAPLGALVLRLVPRVVMLLVVSLLAMLQLVWALVDQRVGPAAAGAVLAGVGAAFVLFVLLARLAPAPSAPVTR